MAPATLDDVLQIVRQQLNVSQVSGRITVTQFNRALRHVIVSLHNDLVRKMEMDQEVSDDLRPFVVTLGSGLVPPLTVTNGQAELPEDYERLVVSHRKYAEPSAQCGTPQEIKTAIIRFYPTSKFYYRLSSTLFAPTRKRPIFTHENRLITVAPSDITSIGFSYIRKPAIPFYDFIITGGAQVYLPPGAIHNGTNPAAVNGTPSRSVEIDFEAGMIPEIVNRLVAFMSVPKEAQLQIQTSGRNK